MIKKLIIFGICAFAMGLFFSPAQAAFEYRGLSSSHSKELPPPVGIGMATLAVPVAPVERIVKIEEINVDSAHSKIGYYGFGRDIPLSIAIKQIVPTGITPVYHNESEIDFGRHVSWEGGGDWYATLSQMLKQQGLSHHLEGSQLYISPADGSLPAAAPAPAPVKTLPPMALSPSAQVPSLPSAPRWTSLPGETLRATLERWSQLNGTALHWTIDYDYRLKQPFAASGSFTEAVTRLLDSFRKTQPRPYGALVKNQALVIRAYGIN